MVNRSWPADDDRVKVLLMAARLDTGTSIVKNDGTFGLKMVADSFCRVRSASGSAASAAATGHRPASTASSHENRARRCIAR